MSEAAAEGAQDLVREKVLDPDELPEGRVRPVTCHLATVCMTRFEGEYAALDNKCPHQGRPLGEGSIENGWQSAEDRGMGSTRPRSSMSSPRRCPTMPSFRWMWATTPNGSGATSSAHSRRC
jgi:hypothetical protein